MYAALVSMYDLYLSFSLGATSLLVRHIGQGKED